MFYFPVKDGKRYYDILIDYCRSNHITDFKIETIPSRVDQVYCYTSSTTIQNTLYRSEGKLCFYCIHLNLGLVFGV
jgi:hypothetical protein